MELSYKPSGENNPVTDQAGLEKWVKQEFQRANAYLAENGILFESVFTENCRYLAPMLAVWKIKDRDKKLYWVISGDVPVDLLTASVAENAREAIKHFSLAWQIKAEAIIREESSDKVQREFAELLINKAEFLYQIQAKDELWKNE